MLFSINNQPLEQDPLKPTIFLSHMPDWVNNIGWKDRVEDHFIVYSRRDTSIGNRIFETIGGLVVGGLALWVNLSMFYDIVIIIITFICFVFPFIVLVINAIQNSYRDFRFNRMDGTLTMPSNWLMWNNKKVTIPLEEVRYMLRLVAGPFGGVTIKVIFPQYKNPNRLLKLTYGAHGMVEVKRFATFDIRSEYSVINWFMDKNRPLPPGTAFEPYREEDYLRRRSEGFPPPLYPSAIETPEWEGAITKYGDKAAKERFPKLRPLSRKRSSIYRRRHTR